MRTKQQYIERLATMPRNLYMNGQEIDRTDEAQETTLNTIGLTFEYAASPEYQDLCTASSHLNGEKTNRFTHIRQSEEDLHKKQDMTRALCQIAGGCIQGRMGIDAANTIYNASYEADRQNDGATEYRRNFVRRLERSWREDLLGCCAQTGVKGDRMKRPWRQQDPEVSRVPWGPTPRERGAVSSPRRTHVSPRERRSP